MAKRKQPAAEGKEPESEITPLQEEILRFASGFVSEHGYPPTLSEIGKACGIANSSSVDYHLRVLTAQGKIRRADRRHRGIELTQDPSELPILGRVGAGSGMIAQDAVEGTLNYKSFVLGTDFLLRVKGDSMIEEGIMEGDLVQVRRQPTANDGDIVVALVGEEGVVKRLRRFGRAFQLESANPRYSPITVDFQVVGKVIGLVRQYR
ncbi:MAG: repressor LexA [Elusimicrobia bacterium]|nr:repressor LexA [Elusimicrobiota bacterium]